MARKPLDKTIRSRIEGMIKRNKLLRPFNKWNYWTVPHYQSTWKRTEKCSICGKGPYAHMSNKRNRRKRGSPGKEVTGPLCRKCTQIVNEITDKKIEERLCS